MRISVLSLVLVVVLVPVADAQTSRGAIKKDERDYQNQCYERWWNSKLNWKFDELPTKGVVSAGRLPYAGYIYPDGAGGTMTAMRKYDRAFHRGRGLAASYEQRDIDVHKEARRIGLFRLRTRMETPSWHGHCNGWTAAAIRHAEPRTSVKRNGVVFSPADIKSMLAELYMYTDTEFLGGIDSAINPGTLHVVLANWLGIGSYPIGMDTTIGKEVWNYPIYSYAYASTKRSATQVEVNLNIANVDATGREFNKAPRKKKYKRFHYALELDKDGKIVGGRYFGDSSRIDMLWAPLQPIQGGKKGNESGNPHLSVKTVLAIWRDSVPEETRKLYPNIDPTDEDRMPELDADDKDTDPAAVAQDGLDKKDAADPPKETEDTPTVTASETPPAATPPAETSPTETPSTDPPSTDPPSSGPQLEAPALTAPETSGTEAGSDGSGE